MKYSIELYQTGRSGKAFLHKALLLKWLEILFPLAILKNGVHVERQLEDAWRLEFRSANPSNSHVASKDHVRRNFLSIKLEHELPSHPRLTHKGLVAI